VKRAVSPGRYDLPNIRRKAEICGPTSCAITKVKVDTAAEKTVIPRKIAEELGLQYTGKKMTLKSASGHPFVADEALASISFRRTGCKSTIPVAVPREEGSNSILVGNDYMAETRMVVGYTTPRIFACPLPSKKKSVETLSS